MSFSGGGWDPGRLGRVLVFVAWILALGLLAWLFAGMLEQRRNPNQDPESRTGPGGSAEVVLRRDPLGHFRVTGRINGRPVELLLDTGATHVVVPGELAQRLGLRQGPAVRTETAAGAITTYLTVVDSVEIGDIRLEKVTATINPARPGGEVLLGMAFLQHLEWSHQDRRLLLRQRRP